jgi:putative hydrolase of the HAD superfamily
MPSSNSIRRDPARVILFDAAGTLFRIRDSVGAIYAEQAVAYGLPRRPGLAVLLEDRFREAFPEMPRPVYRPGDTEHNHAVDRGWWRLLVQRVLQGLGPLEFEPFFEAVYRAFAAADVWQLYPEVSGVLETLRRHGVRLAIVSNFDARLLPVCEGLGLREAVDAIVFAAEAGAAKPDPLIFRLALRRLDADVPKALHVGDSLEEDVDGARAAGLRAVLLERGLEGRPDLRTRAPVIRDLSALLPLVGV